MPQHVLIIDDEPDLLELLGMTLSRMGLNVDKANCVRAAIAKLSNTRYDLCLTDMRLPDGDGIDVIKYGQQHCPGLPIAMITAHGDVETAIDALKLGAFDFLNKPVEMPRLKKLVETALKTAVIPAQDTSQQLLGEAANIKTLRETIAKVARNQAPVFIQGESGSGKELVARLVHQMGARKDGPFIPINCGAIPSELMESEFFGHKKGSFTGATSDKIGLFEAASGGTLFLDEIADLPLTMQVKLLRAIQEKKVRPVGSHHEIDVDVRFLSATHKDLGKLVGDGQFRADLFFRLNVIEIKVPALRQRKADIPILTQHILGKMGRSSITLEERVTDALLDYDFPGNIRELENILERAVAMSDGERITLDDLQLDQHNYRQLQPTLQTHNVNTAIQPAVMAPPTEKFTDDGESFIDLEGYLAEIEKTLITETLEACRWNRTAAAKRLGLSFRSLRYRLEKLGIE